ncbi:hypothetical protein FACS189434_09160 [Bacteroidia bacterium]|nr:hypothetical protein FACS189434_09160 [Bacteroidia bacterium]
MKTIETTSIIELNASKIAAALKPINGFDISASELKERLANDILNLHYIANSVGDVDYKLETNNLVYRLEMFYRFACNLEKELTTN